MRVSELILGLLARPDSLYKFNRSTPLRCNAA